MDNKKNENVIKTNNSSKNINNREGDSDVNLGKKKNSNIGEKLFSGDKIRSDSLSVKSSSSSSDFNDYEKDKYYRESLSRSESLDKKKRKRSASRELNTRERLTNPSPIKTSSDYSKKVPKRKDSKSRSKSPKYSAGMKNKITSIITEKNSTKIFIPGFDGPLVSISLFNELQHNILPADTLENSYKDYKSKYEQKRFQSFYIEHQHDEWFKEKYDSELNEKWKNERNSQCQKLAQNFFQNMSDGLFKNLKLELRDSDENNRNIKILTYGYNKEKGEFEEKERDLSLIAYKQANEATIDISSSPYYGFDPDKLTLFLHQIPRNVSRWQILEVLKKLPGLMSMSLSEPIKNQNYVRYCWITFDSEESCELAYESLIDYRFSNDYKVSPIKSKSSTLKRIRVTPSYFEERINEDLEFSKSCIQIFDKQKGIVNNNLLESKEIRSKENQLDLQILYLRRVHGFCFYCIEEFEDERALATKCDNIHLRYYKCLGHRKPDLLESNKYEAEWDKNFTSLVKQKIELGFEINKTTSEINEELNKKRKDYCRENTSCVNPERYLCNICSKMFKGPNFIYNHIFNKHMDLIQENVDKEYYDHLKYENYVKDTNKIYEKYKIISSMDEYLYYLNAIKTSQHGEGTSQDSRRHYSGKHFRDRDRERADRDKDRESYRRKRHPKDFRDLDNPENLPSSSAQSAGRHLISYEDL